MKSEGQKLRALRDAEHKKRDRSTLRELAERIKTHRHKRRARLVEIRGLCRIGRQNLRDRVQKLRAETLEGLRNTIRNLREAERDQCGTSQRDARAELSKQIEEARAELERERRAFRERYGRKSAGRGRARERAEESADEVAHNLPPELVPVFRKVQKQIKGGPRRTRTEAFLEWAEENPDDVHAILYQAADRDVARLIREHETVEKRLRKTSGAYEDPEALAHSLAGVPF